MLGNTLQGSGKHFHAKATEQFKVVEQREGKGEWRLAVIGTVVMTGH